GRAGVPDPAVFAVVPPQPVLHLELDPGLERISVDTETGLEIVRVDALGPAVAQLLRQASSGEVEPALVEEGAASVDAGHPDENGRTVRQGSEVIVDLHHAVAPHRSAGRNTQGRAGFSHICRSRPSNGS